jgi:hypothetical protein
MFYQYQMNKAKMMGLTEIFFGDAAIIENEALENLTGRISATTAPPKSADNNLRIN